MCDKPRQQAAHEPDVRLLPARLLQYGLRVLPHAPLLLGAQAQMLQRRQELTDSLGKTIVGPALRSIAAAGGMDKDSATINDSKGDRSP